METRSNSERGKSSKEREGILCLHYLLLLSRYTFTRVMWVKNKYLFHKVSKVPSKVGTYKYVYCYR
jgi:hypothetical protein